MKGVLVWPDGRREATPHAGANSILYPKAERGGTWQHTFTARDVERDGDETVILYRWTSSRDISEEMAEADRAIREQTNAVLRRGLGLDVPLERPSIFRRAWAWLFGDQE